MKAIFVIGAILATAFVAMPAAAQCTPVEESGTVVCTEVNPTDLWNRQVTISQDDVGSAGYSSMEYSFWGMSQRGSSVWLYTDYDGPLGWNYASVDSYCFDFGGEGACDYEDIYVFAFVNGVAITGASVSRSIEGANTCVWLDLLPPERGEERTLPPVFQCDSLP